MNEERIGLYLELIERLLSCPSGEESEILQAHRELWDEGFVLALRGVAEQMRENGQENVAFFLLNLAGQLAEVLGMSKSDEDTGTNESDVTNHREFLYVIFQPILQTVIDSQANPEVVYPLLKKYQNYLDDDFADFLLDWGEHTLSRLETVQKISWGLLVIGGFSNLIIEFPFGEKASNIEIAIVGYKLILDIFLPEYNVKTWAKIQSNLAYAYSERIRGDRAANLEAAINHYTLALSIYKYEAFPEEWAKTQNNLAIVYYERVNGEKAENIDLAIACFTNILKVYTCDTFPQQWADAQNSLGSAYCERIKGGRAENIEEAILFYNAALEIQTLDIAPKRWALLQKNQGEAYRRRIKGEKAENIEMAITCGINALSIYTREAFPQEWAGTQSNLAVAYNDRIRGKKADNIEMAITCGTNALEIYTYEDFPQQWAMTQHILATAYQERISGEKIDNIERAISLYNAALKVLTPQAFPQEWANTQNNLGMIYQDRTGGEKADNLEKAISFLSAALEVCTRQAFPEDWAGTQNNLANAYRNRIRGSRNDNIKQAIASYISVLEVFTCNSFPQEHAHTLYNLGLAYLRVPNLQQAYNNFTEAINTFELLRSKVQSGYETKQKLAEEYNRVYLTTIKVCIELAATEPTYYTKAIEYAERSKARNLVELLATRDLYPKGNIPATVLDQLSRLRREIDAEQRRLDNQRATRNSDLNIGERSLNLTTSTAAIDRAHLNQLKQQLSDLIAHEISSIDPEFALTQTVTPIPYSEIQTLTSPNTAILEWYILNDKFLTFIITPQSPTPKVYQSSPKDFAALTAWGDRYLTDYQLDKTSWRDNLASRLQKLAEILHLKEILEQIPTQCDRLILIPHRFLHLFPLHALSIDSSQTLLDLFPQGVSYAPSCQLLQQAQNRQRPDFNHLFAIQNPTKDLLFTDLEVAAIKQHFNPQDVLIQGEAKKSCIDDLHLQAAHCAHFSCHGYFNFAQPLLSALLLADSQLTPPIPTEDPDRYLPLRDGNAIDLSKCLTLADIFALDFRSCRLVVLSACETGISDFQSVSDEYISLPSGFLVAGSSNVVPTLWAVNDLSTSFLMIKFYQLLKAGLSVAIALNSAQRWLRDITIGELQDLIETLPLPRPQRESVWDILSDIGSSETKPFQSPYHWAAFCAVGQ